MKSTFSICLFNYIFKASICTACILNHFKVKRDLKINYLVDSPDVFERVTLLFSL